MTVPDGLRLYARDYGADNASTASRLPVLCLPGLSRNSRDFHALAVRMSSLAEKPRRVVTIDYRGRGKSAWDEDKTRYQIPVEAGDVLHLCDTLGIDKAIVIGTSRGGLIAHFLGQMRPALLCGLILNDIGPVIETAGLLQIRQYLEAQTRYRSWEDAVQGLKAIHGPGFPALSEADWVDMATSILVETDDGIVSDFDPALIEPLRQIAPGQSLPDLWPLFAGLAAVPMMTIRGEHSTILSEVTLADMKRRRPDMQITIADGQGHAPLLHIGEVGVRIEALMERLP